MKLYSIFNLVQYICVIIILGYYILYGFITPNPFGLSDALRITIGLGVFTLIVFLVGYLSDKKKLEFFYTVFNRFTTNSNSCNQV